MRISDSFDTVSERLEKFNSWKDHSPHFWSRGVELNPNDNVCIVKGTGNEKQWMYTHNLVTTVGDEYYAKKITLKSADGSAYADTNFASDGILFHHDGATTVTSSIIYGAMVLRNGSATPAQGHDYSDVTGSLDASSGSGRNTTKTLRTVGGTVNYPRHNDNDSDNTGGGNDQVTWSYEWATSDFNTTSISDLTGGCIVDRATSATAGVNAKLLTTFSFASAFEKTASDTLKIFVNHTFEGA